MTPYTNATSSLSLPQWHQLLKINIDWHQTGGERVSVCGVVGLWPDKCSTLLKVAKQAGVVAPHSSLWCTYIIRIVYS